ncbi:hypothetical protein EW026_g7356 [Hermanssonia centrifuga]|uniref:G-patch domain-containing protein n=1 Tax=Hermanssonia centrifuga TaxID=98765 RepID=A0A4S4K958_9APHY|nr:hypothetical protein EW026_g7356 [Hermanssonia centrifuga]
MPLDGHAYLVSQGWEGKGTGLRNGAISRPVIVTQKKTLSGIGKDRDEAFPFWDHVFSAAANSIKVKCYDSDSEDTEPSGITVSIHRTTTGIISNRRPTTGTPVLSGVSTPLGEPSSSSASGSTTPRLSVMAAAKQEAARRTLYSRFFRGPVIGSEFEERVLVAEGKVNVVENAVTVEEALKAVKKEKKKRKSDADIGEERDGDKRDREKKRPKRSGSGPDQEEKRLSKRAKEQKRKTRKDEESRDAAHKKKKRKRSDSVQSTS